LKAIPLNFPFDLLKFIFIYSAVSYPISGFNQYGRISVRVPLPQGGLTNPMPTGGPVKCFGDNPHAIGKEEIACRIGAGGSLLSWEFKQLPYVLEKGRSPDMTIDINQVWKRGRSWKLSPYSPLLSGTAIKETLTASLPRKC